ncbi:carbohydrate-binding protein [Roseateles chitinivorans]|uniref:carbohydrate-binding protein n=1 Tax=Roseateles chitinivorans TaxID=2917965 RepID=UPI003D6779ED
MTQTSRPLRACVVTVLTWAASSAVLAAGATTTFRSLEAESGTLVNGARVVSLTTAPTTRFASPELEASGHAYVALTATGQEVWWTNTTGKPISFINVRASIPDAPAGGGITATLNLYVNGVFRQRLNLNSRQSWIYEGAEYQASDQNPARGRPRVFYDEASAFVVGEPIGPGSTFSLKRDADNTAAFYNIDVVDVENPPPPLPQPANSISITSCGAVADTVPTNGAGNPQARDSTAAIQNCINQAQAQRKTLWVPPGIFYLKGSDGLVGNGVTIEGAGMWYSTIYRDVPLPYTRGGLGALFQLTSATVRNLHLDSNARSREPIDGAGGAMDITGTNWLAEKLWTQHVLSGFWASGTGGVVRDNRLTSIWADGCNLNNVSMGATIGNNLTATNNFVRGTGDDAMAINSVNYNDTGSGRVFYTAMSNATLSNNTLIGAWNGKGLGIYGGSGHRVVDNHVADTARYIGLGLGRFGVNGSDLHSTRVTGNRVERAGGNGFDQGQPALQIGNGGDGQNVGVVDDIYVAGNTVVGALYDGIGFSAASNVVLEQNTVVAPWRNGIVVQPPFYPAPSGSARITANAVQALANGAQPFINNSGGFRATLSQNSWQLGRSASAFRGQAVSLPGTLQAANYDNGGATLGYSVLTINGTGNSDRPDGVDLEQTADEGGGYNLGWTGSGQWFRYSVNVPSAGNYTASFRVASPSGAPRALHLADASGRSLAGDIDVPATGGWQNWTTITATVRLAAGPQVLTVFQDAPGWNLHRITFAPR